MLQNTRIQPICILRAALALEKRIANLDKKIICQTHQILEKILYDHFLQTTHYEEKLVKFSPYIFFLYKLQNNLPRDTVYIRINFRYRNPQDPFPSPRNMKPVYT